ncbi:MAG: O-antigen ligase family protein [Alphaproteobacteria bacterium]|nr:O-antigen ligase family protein [Alphaproteobacteria bacterium]
MTGTANWTQVFTTFDRERSERIADGLAVALAVSLPWSTSATSILAVLWGIAVLPTLSMAAVRRTLLTAAGGLPVLFWLLAMAGMLWAVDVSMAERLDGFSPFHKLLVIPVLIVQFQRSDRAPWVLKGFLISCGVLLALSWLLTLRPDLPWPWLKRDFAGIPVKDYIAQSGEFTFCAFALAAIALYEQRRGIVILLLLFVISFLANVFYVTPSRTPLVAIPLLFLLFGGKLLSRSGAVGLLFTAILVGALVWSFTPSVRDNVFNVVSELRSYEPEGARTRAGERLEFWRKSIGFVAEAPILGHGTGSIRGLFRVSVDGKTGMAGLQSAQSDLGRCNSARADRHCGTCCVLDSPPTFIQRTGTSSLDWASDRGRKYYWFTIRLTLVRFYSRLELRRRGRSGSGGCPAEQSGA